MNTATLKKYLKKPGAVTFTVIVSVSLFLFVCWLPVGFEGGFTAEVFFRYDFWTSFLFTLLYYFGLVQAAQLRSYRRIYFLALATALLFIFQGIVFATQQPRLFSEGLFTTFQDNLGIVAFAFIPVLISSGLILFLIKKLYSPNRQQYYTIIGLVGGILGFLAMIGSIISAFAWYEISCDLLNRECID